MTSGVLSEHHIEHLNGSRNLIVVMIPEGVNAEERIGSLALGQADLWVSAQSPRGGGVRLRKEGGRHHAADSVWGSKLLEHPIRPW